MKTSARNQLTGTVTAVRQGAVNDEIELKLPGGALVTAVITRQSTDSLGLKQGVAATALVKASSVMVATELVGGKLSARNQLPGAVAQVRPGAVNAEVDIALDGGGSVAAIITLASVRNLGLVQGKRVVALFKASSVILLKD